MILLKMRAVLYYLLPVILLITFSCNDSSEVRKYQEKNPTSSQNSQQVTPEIAPAHGNVSKPGHSHFQWDTPEGWIEDPNASGFRIASFTIKSGNRNSICTIIPLQGEAGGIKANVSRWLGQITNTMNPDETTLEKILAKQEKFLTKGQFPAVMVDLTPFTPETSDNSILATIINIQGNSLFVKMSGDKSLLIENKDKFISLSKSLRFAASTE